MKKETYTIALMPASGRRMRSFSVSSSAVILILVSCAVVVILSLTAGSIATWRYCRRQEKEAAEAIQNYKVLHKELKDIRKSYSNFRSILVDPEDDLGKGGPKVPELTSDYDSESPSASTNIINNTDIDVDSALMEAASLKADLKALDKIRLEKLAEFAATPSIWPVKFEPRSQLWISSGFGRRRNPFTKAWEMHSGVDIPAPLRTPLIATADGTITKMGKDRFLGNYIEIRHSKKYSTLYGHINHFAKNIKKGTKVERGETIGYMGTTGRSTGSHIHYEVRLNGKRVNPMNYILN